MLLQGVMWRTLMRSTSGQHTAKTADQMRVRWQWAHDAILRRTCQMPDDGPIWPIVRYLRLSIASWSPCHRFSSCCVIDPANYTAGDIIYLMNTEHDARHDICLTNAIKLTDCDLQETTRCVNLIINDQDSKVSSRARCKSKGAYPPW